MKNKKNTKSSRTHARELRAHVKAPVNRSNLTSERSFASSNHILQWFEILPWRFSWVKEKEAKKVSLSTDKLCHLRSIWPSYLFNLMNLIYDVSSLFRHEWQLHFSTVGALTKQLYANFRCRYQFIYIHTQCRRRLLFFPLLSSVCTLECALQTFILSSFACDGMRQRPSASNSYARKLGHLFTASHHHHYSLAFCSKRTARYLDLIDEHLLQCERSAEREWVPCRFTPDQLAGYSLAAVVRIVISIIPCLLCNFRWSTGNDDDSIAPMQREFFAAAVGWWLWGERKKSWSAWKATVHWRRFYRRHVQLAWLLWLSD